MYTYHSQKLPVCSCIIHIVLQGAITEGYSCRVAEYTICAHLKHTHTHTFLFSNTILSFMCLQWYNKCSCACAVKGSPLLSHHTHSNRAVAMAAQSFLLNHSRPPSLRPLPCLSNNYGQDYCVWLLRQHRRDCHGQEYPGLFSETDARPCGSGEQVCARWSA